MAYGEWLVPKPSIAAQARLQHDIATVRNATSSDLEALRSLTVRLLQQNMHLNTLVRQAIYHCAEQEMQELLGSRPHVAAEPPS
jgi:hypothetical protein